MGKKVLIVFRGGYERVTDVEFICKNIQMYVQNPLLENNTNAMDIVFSTYNNDITKLHRFTEILQPKKTFFTHSGQITNFKETLNHIEPLTKDYDCIVFLRFEAIYKKPIVEWNCIEKDGLCLPFKEDTKELFAATGWHNDNIITVSTNHFANFCKGIHTAQGNLFMPPNTLHNLANMLKTSYPDIPIHCMVDGYYQSNSIQFTQSDEHLSPLYILTHYPYHGKDKQLYGL